VLVIHDDFGGRIAAKSNESVARRLARVYQPVNATDGGANQGAGLYLWQAAAQDDVSWRTPGRGRLRIGWALCVSIDVVWQANRDCGTARVVGSRRRLKADRAGAGGEAEAESADAGERKNGSANLS